MKNEWVVYLIKGWYITVGDRMQEQYHGLVWDVWIAWVAEKGVLSL